MCIKTNSKQFFSKKKHFLGDFWPFSASFCSPEFIFGPRNLFRDLWFRSRTYVRPSVRPSGIYFLTARRIFLNFFLMDSSWEGAKTYRARFLNFSFFAPVKVQKHLFFVLFFKFLKNRVVKFFIFWYFILLDVPDIFVFCSESVAANLHPENEQKHLFLCTFSAHLRAQAEWADKIFWNLDTTFFSMWQLFMFFGLSR